MQRCHSLMVPLQQKAPVGGGQTTVCCRWGPNYSVREQFDLQTTMVGLDGDAIFAKVCHSLVSID